MGAIASMTGWSGSVMAVTTGATASMTGSSGSVTVPMTGATESMTGWSGSVTMPTTGATASTIRLQRLVIAGTGGDRVGHDVDDRVERLGDRRHERHDRVGDLVDDRLERLDDAGMSGATCR